MDGLANGRHGRAEQPGQSTRAPVGRKLAAVVTAAVVLISATIKQLVLRRAHDRMLIRIGTARVVTVLKLS